jgi:flagellar basal body rod protein FlgG
MSDLTGIIAAARTLSYYSRLQEITANNLANVNTAGFKADHLAARRLGELEHPVPVEVTDFSQGGLRVTGRPLDVALEGKGFLEVETKAGDRLIRGGSLRLDGDGTLLDPEGNPVLGEQGRVVIPEGGSIEIRPDGTVLADGKIADKLRIVVPAEGSKLLKESAGRFLVDRPEALEPVEIPVRQGQLEEANFNPIAGMISLVEIQRAYAANVTAVRSLDGVLGSVTSEVARLS